MTVKPGIRDLLWMAAGAVLLLALALAAFYFRQDQTPAEQRALRARRIDVVGRMRSALAASSDAEKSAVLAPTDQDSQSYADQARAATAEVERGRRELGELLRQGVRERRRISSTNSLEPLPNFSASTAELLPWRSGTAT